jgi:hypothetical protein
MKGSSTRRRKRTIQRYRHQSLSACHTSQGQPPRGEDLLIRDGSMNDEREEKGAQMRTSSTVGGTGCIDGRWGVKMDGEFASRSVLSANFEGQYLWFWCQDCKIEIMRRKHAYIIFPRSHNLVFSDSCPACTLHISNRGISHHFPCNICHCAVPGRLISEMRRPTGKGQPTS